MIRHTLLILLLAAAAQTGIYRWVDERGNVHFSDSPPPGSGAETVEVVPPAVPATPDEGELRRLQLIEDAQAADRMRREDEQAARETQTDGPQTQAARAEECYQTRAQYFWLQREAPVYRDESGHYRSIWRNETYQGERQYLNETERGRALEEIRQQMLTVCDNPFDSAEMAEAQDRWYKSELCASERVRLEALEQPDARASSEDIDRQRRRVAEICR